ncbi:hypothetical protein SAMN05421753_11423 [Planctomicrobium piriforme]|uniref:Uncharacterized protein n=1 Tax=Planctomicrobium piriforme TaxID=1576369 RepID=A0A1I3MIQ5_9PLAN|nr:hypothetical protein SAMN05421753_11423 [Planctomicrobium piriforme]
MKRIPRIGISNSPLFRPGGFQQLNALNFPDLSPLSPGPFRGNSIKISAESADFKLQILWPNKAVTQDLAAPAWWQARTVQMVCCLI